MSVRILLAEDNEDHLFLTVRALRDAAGTRIEVESVRDGEEALDYVYRRGQFTDRERPHLILLDLKMPKVDGLQFLEQLKADPELRSIPVVVLTSSERPEDVSGAYLRGTNSYVTKATTVGGMRDTMRELTEYWLEFAKLPDPPS